MFKYLILSLVLTLALTSCKEDSNKGPNYGAVTVPVQEQLTPLEESVKRGKEIYGELCVTCHLPNGKGVVGNFPPLNPSDWLTSKRTESIHAVKYGLKGEIIVNNKPYNSVMLAQGLDDDEVVDVMNYVIQTWNKGEEVTLEEVKAVKK